MRCVCVSVQCTCTCILTRRYGGKRTTEVRERERERGKEGGKERLRGKVPLTVLT